MSAPAPRWAFNAQAIDGAGDPHLAPGIHLRLIPSQLLGLPAAPFTVFRQDLGVGGSKAQLRTDITWSDRFGAPRIPPFDLTDSTPMTGWLPPPASGVCCWIEVDVVPATKGKLRVDAVIGTPRGEAVAGRLNQPPFQFGASRIERVVVQGAGRVNGVRWIDARSLLKRGKLWRALALPVASGPRYGGIPNAPTLAMQRVRRGAPTRLGLHEAPQAVDPSSAPPATPAMEEGRIQALIPIVQPWLDPLLTDLSAPAYLLERIEHVLDEHGIERGGARINVLGLLMQAALDPGVGRWLGFSDVDEAPPTTAPGAVIAYVVRGLWKADPRRIGDLVATLPPDALTTPSTLLTRLVTGIRLKGGPPGPFLDLWTVACATVANPPLRPSAPRLDAPVNGPWMPLLPPAAQREVVVPLGGVVSGAVIGLARREGAGLVGLNARTPAGRGVSLVPAVPSGAMSVGEGEVADRTAPPEAVAYRAAQADWFGRWSEWSERAAPAGVRPAPPRPVVHATYVAPGVDADGNLTTPSGIIDVSVAVPEVDALPPGSALLAALEVAVDGVVTSIGVPASGPPPTLVVSRDGPALQRADSQAVTIVARWINTLGAPSVDSEPVTLLLSDPRPPSALTMATALRYAARPDATGQARVALTWSPQPGQQRFRVFYTDETRVTARLQKIVAQNLPAKPAAQTVLAALGDAATVVDRAAALTSDPALLSREMFEQVTARPIERPAAGQVRFEHALSGSLRVLSLYRVVAVSGSNVEIPFGAAPLIPVAVPNNPTPPTPLVTAEPVLAPAGAAAPKVRVTIRVPRGLVPAVEFRLRRSSALSADPLQMPIAATGAMPPAGADGAQVVEVLDAGASEIVPGGTLRDWLTYSWRSEVRAAAEPGAGGPAGRWSVASAPAQVTLVPLDPPRPAQALATAPSGAGTEVSWEHPEPLRAGSVGSYRFDVYRTLPNDRARFGGTLSAEASPADGGRLPDRTGRFRLVDADAPVSGTRYRVVVVDPLGRTSPPAEIAVG